MSNVPLSRQELAVLLPHQGNMVLLNTIEHWDEQTIQATSTSHTSENHPLRKEGTLSSMAGIELAAQAMAAHSYLCASQLRTSQNKTESTPRRGFVASTSKVTISEHRLDTLPSQLDINIELIDSSNESSIYSFNITHKENHVISGRLLAVLEPEDT